MDVGRALAEQIESDSRRSAPPPSVSFPRPRRGDREPVWCKRCGGLSPGADSVLRAGHVVSTALASRRSILELGERALAGFVMVATMPGSRGVAQPG